MVVSEFWWIKTHRHLTLNTLTIKIVIKSNRVTYLIETQET